MSEIIIDDSSLFRKIQGRDEIIDAVEAFMSEYPEVDCPLVHRFTKGIYVREIFMPAGTYITSKIHKTEHPFIISKGSCTVWTDEGEEVLIQAPYCGITKPNTRRLLYIHEDCVWTTIHATDKTTPEEVEDDIIQKHDNPLLNDEIKKRNKLN